MNNLIDTILSEADERFDQKFLGHKSDQILDGHYGIIVSNENSIANVKDFLHSEIKRAVGEIVKEIEKMKGTMADAQQVVEENYEGEYPHGQENITLGEAWDSEERRNAVLDEVIKLLSTLTSSNKEDK